MRSFVRTAVVALALLLPAVASADELRVFQLLFLEPGIGFGPAGASVDLRVGDSLSIDGLYAETPWGSTFDYEATLETGPLVSLTIDDSNPDAVHSDYAFRGGVFTLTASWYDKFFVWQQGRYIAPVLALDIQITCEQELSTEDCGSSWGESKGYAFLSIGDGVFDHNLAHALRVQTRGSGPSFDTFILDGISGKPSDSSRDAGSALSQIKPELVATAPEPSILSLLLLVPAFWRRFRR